ncbi:MAG: amino acid permease [Planctomycetia bacterium]|nr:amino acid permease [Planctomycetia bacterium]
MKLTRSLKLWDIVLLNVTAIVSLRWISLAAVGGNTSIILWIAALLLFFVPQGFAVIELTTRLPGEGGIYLWTKKAFGEFHGFLSGWCYWTSNLIYFPNLLVYIAGISVFVLGDGYQALGESKTYVMIFSLLALWIVMIFNIIGLKLGRWINNVGGIGSWISGTVLIAFGITAIVKYGFANPMPAESFFSNIITFDKLSFWASMCFGFAGLELAAVLAGEIKNPQKAIPKATIYSGIIITLVYLLGTFSLLVAIPTSDINIISGFLQGIAAIGVKLGLGWTSQILALLITLGGIGGLMAWFTGAARMPFVAGVDKYLPKAFGRVHPKFGSPHIAIIVQGIVATAFILMSFIGTTVKEAYLILLDTTLLVYFIPYAYMFTAYIVLRRKNIGDNGNIISIPKNNFVAIMVGISGLVTTIFAMIMSLIPSSGVTNVLLYEIKVIGGFLLFVFVGVGIYWWGKKKNNHSV